MKSKITAANVKAHLTYTVEEAAETVGATKQTIRKWVNNKGMKIIEGSRPWLIPGTELKRLASGTRRTKMPKPGPGEMTCMRCRGPRKAYGNMADYIPMSNSTGRLTALCANCEGTMHLFTSLAKLPQLGRQFEISEWGDRID